MVHVAERWRRAWLARSARSRLYRGSGSSLSWVYAGRGALFSPCSRNTPAPGDPRADDDGDAENGGGCTHATRSLFIFISYL